MAKKKIKDITKKQELTAKEQEQVKGGSLLVKPTEVPTDWCICSTKCGWPGWVFGSASRDVSK